MADLGYPATARRLKALVRSLPADLVVSTHPLLTRSLSKALNACDPRPPFAIVVTDLVTGHWSWYERSADRIFVPTDAARDHVLSEADYSPEQVVVTGQPVHPRCAAAAGRREELRQRFGWSETVILLVGGGEGMGGLAERARAIDDAGLAARLVVVCGRNTALRTELDAQSWTMPVEIFGFVENLPELMAAADILVTKGGPGSIMEGCVASLPLLIYDYLPGQELGNIRLVEDAGAGHYVPGISGLITALQRWIEDPAAREQAACCSRALAVPDSAERLARELLDLANP
jgi:1,2-diacylglycerol 3-beta-galactosyltransferase